MLLDHVKADTDWKKDHVHFELDKAHCNCTDSAPDECGPAKDLGQKNGPRQLLEDKRWEAFFKEMPHVGAALAMTLDEDDNSGKQDKDNPKQEN